MNKEQSYKQDIAFKVFGELSKVKDSHRLLVLVAHGFIELMINALIDAKCKNSKRITSNQRDYPHSSKLLILNEVKVISDDVYLMLDAFRKLRNKAAHDPLFTVTKNDLSILIKGESFDPDNLYEFCQGLIAIIWIENFDILCPVFAPNLLKERSGIDDEESA